MIVGIMMIILLTMITITITLHLMSKLLHPKEEEEWNFYSADVGWQYTPTKARYSHRSSKVASSDESALKQSLHLLNQGLIMEMMVTLLTTAVIYSMQLSSFLFHMWSYQWRTFLMEYLKTLGVQDWTWECCTIFTTICTSMTKLQISAGKTHV